MYIHVEIRRRLGIAVVEIVAHLEVVPRPGVTGRRMHFALHDECHGVLLLITVETKTAQERTVGTGRIVRDDKVDLVQAVLLTRPAELGIRRWTAHAIAFIGSRAEESRQVENEKNRLERTAAVVDGPCDVSSAVNING